MTSTKASVSYKKKDGSLTISEDTKYLFWTPVVPPSASPAVTIPVADITNLQQTPATVAKVALKVFIGEESHVFSFTSKENARKEQETVTESLRDTIAANKASVAAQLVPAAASTPAQGSENGGQSAAMAMAKAASSKNDEDAWYDDNKLKADFQLQRSLLESDQTLNDRFTQALRDRPDTVTIPQFTAQFWSARVHLLRAHAIDKAQRMGEYNVLPEIKYTVKPGEEGQPDVRTLNITKEQIKLIFKQYPVVAQAYNENCPPLDPGQFWQRFFSSRLLKKLKGQHIARDDPSDPVLDKYLDRKETGPVSIAGIPKFMDLEGNQQNNSQQRGNRPDAEMRESVFDRPILHVLNGLSEKMMAHVAPEDGEAHRPIGMDEATFEQVQLRDLALNDVDNRVRLSLKEQQRSSGRGDDTSVDAKRYAKQDPIKVLSIMQRELQPQKLGADEYGTLHLSHSIHYDSDEDSEDEAPTNGDAGGKRKPPVRAGTQNAMTAATTSILTSIHQRRSAVSHDPNALHGLSQNVFDTLTITQNTTIEFLHYFWTLFLSGDPSKSQELSQIITTLDRSLDRINAVAAKAEEERQEKINKTKKQIKEYYERTGKKRKLDESKFGGGKAVVEVMIRPTVAALRTATERYRVAFEEQSKEAAAILV